MWHKPGQFLRIQRSSNDLSMLFICPITSQGHQVPPVCHPCLFKHWFFFLNALFQSHFFRCANVPTLPSPGCAGRGCETRQKSGIDLRPSGKKVTIHPGRFSLSRSCVSALCLPRALSSPQSVLNVCMDGQHCQQVHCLPSQQDTPLGKFFRNKKKSSRKHWAKQSDSGKFPASSE